MHLRRSRLKRLLSWIPGSSLCLEDWRDLLSCPRFVTASLLLRRRHDHGGVEHIQSGTSSPRQLLPNLAM